MSSVSNPSPDRYNQYIQKMGSKNDPKEPDRIGKRLLAGLHVIEKNPNIDVSSRTFYFKRWINVHFSELTTQEKENAIKLISDYNQHKFNDFHQTLKDQEPKFQEVFDHFFNISKEHEAGQALFAEQDYAPQINKFINFFEQFTNLTEPQKNTLKNFMAAHPNLKNYDKALEVIKERDIYTNFTEKDFRELVKDPKKFDLKAEEYQNSENVTKVILYNRGLAEIGRFNQPLKESIEEKANQILESQGKKGNPALLEEMKDIYQFFSLLNDLEHPIAGSAESKEEFLKEMTEGVKTDQVDVLSFISTKMKEKRAQQCAAFIDSIDDHFAGKGFSHDFKKIYVDRDEFKDYSSGEKPILQHPFFTASPESKILMVMQKKAEGVIDKELFNGCVHRLDKNDPEKLYLKINSLISMAENMQQPQGMLAFFQDKTSNDDHRSLVNQLLVAWLPTLVKQPDNFEAWQKNLVSFVHLSKLIGESEIQYGPDVIAAVLNQTAFEFGFPNEIGKFQTQLDNPNLVNLLLHKCADECNKEQYQAQYKSRWETRFKVDSSIFKSYFSEKFFTGPIISEKLAFLERAAQEGLLFSEKLNVPVECIAEGYVNYFNENGVKGNLPSEQIILPFCDHLPPLSDWQAALKTQLNINSDAAQLLSSSLEKNLKGAPRTSNEVSLIADLYKAGLKALKNEGIPITEISRQAVANSILEVVIEQRDFRRPIELVSDQKILACCRKHLPALEDWQDHLKNAPVAEKHPALVQKLIYELAHSELKGPVSLSEFRTIVQNINLLIELEKKGPIDPNIGAIAIRRLMQAQLESENGFNPVKKENMLASYFEAIIESVLQGNDKMKTEGVIAVCKKINGIEEVPLNLEGQRRLQLLALCFADPSFAGGRPLDHFRVTRKFGDLLTSLNVLHANDLNTLKLDDKLFIEIFDQNQTYIFKNQNARELLESIEQKPAESIHAILTPMIISLLKGDEKMEKEAIAIIQKLAQGESLGVVSQFIGKYGGDVASLGGLEFDIGVSSESILSGLITIINNSHKVEMADISGVYKENKEFSLEREEAKKISLVAELFQMGVNEFAKAQQQRASGVPLEKLSPIANLLNDFSGVRMPDWFIQWVEKAGTKLVKGTLNNTIGAKIIRKCGEQILRKVCKDQITQINEKIKLLDIPRNVIVNELNQLQTKQKLSKSENDKLNFMLSIVNLDPSLRIQKTSELKQQLELFQNVSSLSHEIVDVGMNIAMNILETGDIQKHFKLINYIMDLAKNPDKPVNREELGDLFFTSAEALLQQATILLPGFFETGIDGMKSVTSKPSVEKKEINLKNVNIISAGEKKPTDNELTVQSQRNTRFKKILNENFAESVFDSSNTREMKKIAREKVIPHVMKEFFDLHIKYPLNADDMQEIAYLVEIGVSLIDKKDSGFNADEVAFACKKYCEDLLQAGKPIKAPEWNHLFGNIASEQQQALIPHAFDQAVANLVKEAAKLPETQAEGMLNEKIKFLINSQRIGISDEGLNANGRAVLKAMVDTVLSKEFLNGQSLLNPMLIDRMPLILQAASLDEISSINRADVGVVGQALKTESQSYLGKMNPMHAAKSFVENPKKSIPILADPILNTLLEGSAEKREARKLVSNLAADLTGVSIADRIQNVLKKRLGPILTLEGVELEVNVSTRQMFEGVKNNLAKLSNEMESSKLTSAEATKYGIVASGLLRTVEIISKAQAQRNELIGKKSAEEPTAKMAFVLNELGSLKGRLLFPLLLSGIQNIDKLIPFIKPIVGSALKLFLESKILELKNLGVLTQQQADDLILFESLYKNQEELLNLTNSILIAFTKRHQLSEHEGLINYIQKLAENPGMKVDEKELLKHFITSANIILKEADVYEGLIPGILGALTRLSHEREAA